MIPELLFRWRRAVLSADGPTNPTTRYVLLALSMHMDESGGSCFPSTKLISAETKLSERSVCTHIEIAVAGGWLEKRLRTAGKGSGKGWRRHTYQAVLPAIVLKQVQQHTSHATEAGSVAKTLGTERHDNLVLKEVQSSTSLRSSKRPLVQEIEKLKSRYSSRHLIDSAFQAIASTRKNGKVADSILLAQLRKWERYPADHVTRGIQTYLDKNCAGDGKDEKYLLGIIRGINKRASMKSQAPKISTPKLTEIDLEAIYQN